MVGEIVTQRITSALKDLYKNQGFKLEYVEAWTKQQGYPVGRQAVSRALNGKVRRMREETAKGLAQLIEEETAGKISASELLSPRSTSYRQDLKGATIEGENWSNMDLSGADFSGATLDGVNFSRANLLSARFQEATLLNCNFSNADLVNGNLKNIGADGCTFREADLRASSWRNSRLSNSTFRNAKHTGVDMRDVKFANVTWKSDRTGAGSGWTGPIWTG